MPQLDKFTFFTQVFYLIVVFFAFYLLATRLVLPRLFAVMRVRRQRLASLEARNSFLKENEQLIKTYETNILANFLNNSYKSLNNIYVQSLSIDFNEKLRDNWVQAWSQILKSNTRSFVIILSNLQKQSFLLDNTKVSVFSPNKKDIFVVSTKNNINEDVKNLINTK